MDSEITRIISRRGEPFIIHNLRLLLDCEERPLEVPPVLALCRCGQSENKPYCDGSHAFAGFSGEKSPDRIKDKLLSYRGEEITIHDNRSICSHDGSCFRGLPRVFRKKQQFRWIWPDNAEPGRIEEVIRQCPSGALSWTREGITVTDWETRMYIRIRRNGPLEVKGGILLEDDQGSVPRTADHYTLCRCGLSLNKPFCDGHHLLKGFDDSR